MKRGEYDLYTDGPRTLDCRHVYIDAGTVDELLLLQDDCCRLNTSFENASPYVDYDIGDGMKVKVTPNEMKLGAYGYEGFERSECGDWDEHVYVSFRVLYNIQDSFGKYYPQTVEQAFGELIAEAHWDEAIEQFEAMVEDDNLTNDQEARREYERVVRNAKEYVESHR